MGQEEEPREVLLRKEMRQGRESRHHHHDEKMIDATVRRTTTFTAIYIHKRDRCEEGGKRSRAGIILAIDSEKGKIHYIDWAFIDTCDA